MNLTTFYDVDGPWPGRLALCARPRGGDWLEDEINGWKREGVTTVCSLLERPEETDLGIADERREVERRGLNFVSIPIEDRRPPDSEERIRCAVAQLLAELEAGGMVVIHCRQGVGRAGLTAACLLIDAGVPADAALARLTQARGVEIPETSEQLRWIKAYEAQGS